MNLKNETQFHSQNFDSINDKVLNTAEVSGHPRSWLTLTSPINWLLKYHICQLKQPLLRYASGRVVIMGLLGLISPHIIHLCGFSPARLSVQYIILLAKCFSYTYF